MSLLRNLAVGVAVLSACSVASHGQVGLQFNGTNQYVTMGAAAGLRSSPAFTIEFWFKRTATGTAGSTGTGGIALVPIVAKGAGESETAGLNANYIVGIDTSTNTLAADFEEAAGPNHPVTSPVGAGNANVIVLNTWYHAAVSYDGSSWRIYLNGNLIHTEAETGSPEPNSSQHFALGAMLTSTGAIPSSPGYFAGALDEVRVWNIARSGTDIANNMNLPIATASNLIGRWGLNEGAGIDVNDSSTAGSAREIGTLSNAPTWTTGAPALFTAGERIVTFQQGVNSYTSALDTTLDASVANAGSPQNATATLTVDGGGDAATNERHTLIRFDNIFGAGSGQIPAGSTLHTATMTLNVSNATANAPNVHRMVANFTAAETWNSFVNGVQSNGTEAQTTADHTPSNMATIALHNIDLFNSVNAWHGGSPNEGIAILPTGIDGLVFDSSDSATGTLRPRLVASYFAPANAAPNAPTLVAPGNGASGQSTSPTLTVNVTDPESDAMTVTYFGRENTIPAPGADFSIIVLPDTQFYSCGAPCSSSNSILDAQLQWIVDNRVSRNIAFVTQLGDCVEHGNDGNVNGANAEWDAANAAWSLIENPITTMLTHGIPYGIAVGNHDQTPINSPRSGADEGATTTRYNNTFGLSRFLGRSYYGGRYDFGAPATYPNNNDNHYQLFSASGLDFIIIHLEYDDTSNATRTAVLNWANGLLQTYSNRRAIVSAHYLLNPAGTFGNQGQATYDALKGNPNLFMMLCGHLDQANRRADVFAGNTVHTLLSDYQTRANGGRGWMRRLLFSPANNTIHVETFSPWANYPTLPMQEQLINSHGDNTAGTAQNDFTLSYTMTSSPPPFTQIGSPITGVTSGSNANIVWPSLNANTTYEWKATASDGTSTTESAVWSFQTQCTNNAACDDGNPCTDDICDNGTCVHTNNTAACDDGNACTTNDMCNAGVCAGTPVNCSPGATCNPANGQCEYPPVTVTFQQGVSGYTGAADTYLNIGEPTTSKATAVSLIVDLVGTVGTPLGKNQTLLRFDNIFGTGAGQIPPGSTIQSATLTVNVTNSNAGTAPCTMHRMLQSWSDIDTWSDRVNGIQTDDAEAWSTPDVTALALTATGLQSATVTDSLITWLASPSSNRGWAILPHATVDDGLIFDSSETATATNRPKLSVTYIPPPPCQSDGECNDNSACTVDTCNAGSCVFTPISCDDNDACTTDTCDPQSGCVHTPISCDDNDGCTDDACNPMTGCTHTPVNCDDGNPCTTDSCLPSNTAALAFDGSNDHVVIGAGSAVTNFGTGSFTIEGWVYTDGGNADRTGIVRIGRQGAFMQIAVQLSGGAAPYRALGGSVDTGLAGGQVDVNLNTTLITANTWTHFALVADRSTLPGNPAGQELRIYLNGGAPIVTNAAAWAANPLTTTDATVFGAARADTGALTAYFDGRMDEIRIWNTVRTQAEIQANMNAQIPSASGLIARWSMNDGTGATVADSVGINHGTLTNGPTWSTTDLVNMGTGGCVHTPIPNCCTTNAHCDDGSACTTDVCDSGTCVNTPITCDDMDPCTTDSCNPATGCVFTPINCDDGNACTVDSCVAGVCQHVVNCDDGNPCTTDTCAPANSAALQFDGSNDHVIMGAAPTLNTTTFTVECWFKRTGAGVGNTTGTGGIASLIPLVAKYGPEGDTPNNLNGNYVLGIDTASNTLAVDFEELTGPNHPASSPAVPASNVIADSVWYHAAASYDGTTWRIYLNGSLIHTEVENATPVNISIQHFSIGTMSSSMGTTQYGRFQGLIDEVRVWNYARSDSQISTNMNSEISSETGLIGRWGLNDGSPSTTAADSSGNSNNGTLANGPVWVTTNLPAIGGGCVHTPVANGTTCTDDGNPCTLDECFNGACAHTGQDADGDGVCDASDLCPGTANGAGVNSEGCSCAQVNCLDDGNPCTLDSCVNGVCSHVFQDADADGVCDANDSCPGTINGAGVNSEGCSCAQVNCLDDGNPCTLDSCVNGVCSHVFEDADADGVCDANDTCPGTANSAGVNSQGCSCAQVSCLDDGNPCTLDSCTNGVCSHVFQDADGDGVCDANDACPGFDDNDDGDNDGIPDGCDVCPSDPANDADNDGVCDSGDLCPGTASGAGVNAEGCSCAQVSCLDDGNPCTLDSCANGVCSHVFQDADDDGVCDANDMCPDTPIGETPNAQGCSCSQIPSCDDGNPCTLDSCASGACSHVFQDADGDGVCDANDACPGTANGAGVNSEGCSCAQVNCLDDGNPCTLDSCTNGACSHVFQDADGDGVCDANDACPGTANGAGVNVDGCSCAQVNCLDDGNPCTLDSCTNGACSHVFQDADDDGVCDANDACPNTPNGETPNTNGCSCSQVDCDDSDPCTLDTCINGVCSHVFQDADGDGVCDANDACPGTANGAGVNSQGCSCVQVSCLDDGNPCTLDSCTNGECSHAFQDADGDGVCDASDVCPGTPTGETTNTQGCSCSQSNCNDNDPCTMDICLNGNCSHTPIVSCYQLSLEVIGTTQVCAGGTLDVALNASGLQEAVNGVQVLLQYDPTRLALNSITVGDDVSSPWNAATPTFFSDTGGAVVYALGILGPGTMADARVATLHFTPLNPGSDPSPTDVTFRSDQGPFQTKITTSTNIVILPTKLDAAPITVGPQIQINLQVQGLTHAATRDVTFVFSDCQDLKLPQSVIRPVSFNASGMGSVLLTGVGAGAEWISATEGHTLRRKLPISFSNGCFATVDFTGANQLTAGDLQTTGVPKDNLVDIVDFAILIARFGTQVGDCVTGLPAECTYGADINGDGIQETADFQAIQINFFQVGTDQHGCPAILRKPIASKDTANALDAETPRTALRLTTLGARAAALSRADLNGDGLIDAADIRAFATRNQLTLNLAFDARLKKLESTAVAP